jgi:hypothetical protein
MRSEALVIDFLTFLGQGSGPSSFIIVTSGQAGYPARTAPGPVIGKPFLNKGKILFTVWCNFA